MRALIQRVNYASVSVGGEILADIGRGLLVFIGVGRNDSPESTCWMAEKISRLRIFPDTMDKMNLSILDTGGEALVVSQFTLYGTARRGNRPGFDSAAEPVLAETLYEKFCENLQKTGVIVKKGRFAAKMKVVLENDGPVTIWIEYPDKTG